ncbi:MAG: hypothetical protein F6K10_42510 [Moorea sp. SIO2B7]|nr:hypothetical protein [Moorena sp. SIO2B7]
MSILKMKKFFSLLISILTHPFISRYAGRYPLVINIFFAILISLSGMNIISIIHAKINANYTIKNTQSLCEKYKDKLPITVTSVKEINILLPDNNKKNLFVCSYEVIEDGIQVEKQLNVKLAVIDDIIPIENPQRLCENYAMKLPPTVVSLGEVNVFLSEINKIFLEGEPLFVCSYKIIEDGDEVEKKLNVELIVVDDRFVGGDFPDDEKIDISDVCQEPETYKDIIQKIQNQGGGQIIKKEAILLETPNIWPAFRWQCQYTFQLDQDRPHHSVSKIYKESTGLDLSIYCKKKFSEDSYPSHKYYNDPYSLYCTNPHPYPVRDIQSNN